MRSSGQDTDPEVNVNENVNNTCPSVLGGAQRGPHMQTQQRSRAEESLSYEVWPQSFTLISHETSQLLHWREELEMFTPEGT